jgi:imidazolonepropionase-like amidohydrolase
MLKIFTSLSLVLAVAFWVVAQTTEDSTKALVFSNAAVIDLKSGRKRLNMTVVVVNDRITAVGRHNSIKVPRNSQIIDARGKFLIPGLWDMHIHAWDANAFYPIILANGVTGIRDMGDDLRSLAAFRQQIESGKRLGPRLFFAGQIIDGLRRENFPFLFSYVETPENARSIVRKLKEGGADFIKVYNALKPDVYGAIADEAKRQNLKFAGHIPISLGVRFASTFGQSTIEHLSGIAVACSWDEENLKRKAKDLLDEMHRLDNQRIQETGDKAKQLREETYAISKRLYELTDEKAFDTFDSKKCAELNKVFRKHTTWHVPTLAVIDGNSLRSDLAQMTSDRLRYFPEFVRNLILQNNVKLSPNQLDLNKRRFQTKLRIVREMHRAKIHLLAGSDSPNGNIFPGFSLHDELEFLVQAGLSPLDALRAATINPALYLNKLDQFGTIEPSKYADLVLLDADPLKDIKNTTRIRAVVTNGRLLDREAIDKILVDTAAKYEKANSITK